MSKDPTEAKEPRPGPGKVPSRQKAKDVQMSWGGMCLKSTSEEASEAWAEWGTPTEAGGT